MNSTKNARITLRSVIDNLSETGLPTSDREVSESNAVGNLTVDERGTIISYSESTEGGEVRTRMEIADGSVSVSRHGAIESSMLFSEGVAHSSVYGAPPYSFDVRILTKKLRGGIGENGGELSIFYDMEIGGAKKSVKMTVNCLV